MDSETKTETQKPEAGLIELLNYVVPPALSIEVTKKNEPGRDAKEKRNWLGRVKEIEPAIEPSFSIEITWARDYGVKYKEMQIEYALESTRNAAYDRLVAALIPQAAGVEAGE